MDPKTIWEKLEAKEQELGSVEYTKWITAIYAAPLTEDEIARMCDDVDFSDIGDGIDEFANLD